MHTFAPGGLEPKRAVVLEAFGQDAVAPVEFDETGLRLQGRSLNVDLQVWIAQPLARYPSTLVQAQPLSPPR